MEAVWGGEKQKGRGPGLQRIRARGWGIGSGEVLGRGGARQLALTRLTDALSGQQ